MKSPASDTWRSNDGNDNSGLPPLRRPLDFPLSPDRIPPPHLAKSPSRPLSHQGAGPLQDRHELPALRGELRALPDLVAIKPYLSSGAQ